MQQLRPCRKLFNLCLLIYKTISFITKAMCFFCSFNSFYFCSTFVGGFVVFFSPQRRFHSFPQNSHIEMECNYVIWYCWKKAVFTFVERFFHSLRILSWMKGKSCTHFFQWSFFVAFHDVDKAENFFLSCSMQNVFFYVIYSPPSIVVELSET